MTISPVKAYDPDKDEGDDTWFRVTTEWRKLTKGWGRGLAQYQAFVNGRGSFWADSSHSYNVESQVFTYTIVVERKLYMYLVKGSALGKTSGQQLVSGATKNIGELGSAGKDNVNR